MNERRGLPEGWSTALLSQLGESVKPGFPSGRHNNEEQGVAHLRPMNVTPQGRLSLEEAKYVEADDPPLLRVGDILFNNTNSPTWVGKTAYVGQDAHLTYSNHMTRIRLKGLAGVPNFYSWQLHNLQQSGYFLARCKNHVNQASISTSYLTNEVQLRVAPVNEQRRIVATIEEQFSRLDAGVAALERVRANLKRYRAAVLKAAMEGKLTETWREDNPDVEPASELLKRILRERRERWEQGQLEAYEAKGKKPPKNWQEKYRETVEPETEKPLLMAEKWLQTSIGRCFEVRVGATPSRARADFWDGTVPWVSSGEIQFCRINETKQHISEAGLRNSSTKLNPAGSVLLGMIGEGRTRGQVAIQDIEAANNQNCAAILVSETEVVPEYIYYWLWSRYEMTRNAGSGNNQPALNKTRVQNLPLALPPIAEQKVLVAEVDRRMSVLREVEAEVDVNLKRASRLRQSILKCAFEGKLVPHDTSDEPASKLLERIREERDQAAPKKKGRMKKPARVAEDPQGSLFTSVESRG